MTRRERATQLFKAVVGTTAQVPEATLAYLVDVWNRVNATTFRITVTMMVVVGTAFRYWLSGIWGIDVHLNAAHVLMHTQWVPDSSWLMFLGSMAGLDVLQFHSKRATYKPEIERTKAEVKETESETTSSVEQTSAPVDSEVKP